MIKITAMTRQSVTIAWEVMEGVKKAKVYWSDRETEKENYRLMAESDSKGMDHYQLKRATSKPHYFLVVQSDERGTVQEETFVTPVHFFEEEQIEAINRGLVAIKTGEGIFLSWRFLIHEVTGYNQMKQGLTGADFVVYREGKPVAKVTDSTNYLDREGREPDRYQVASVINGVEDNACDPVRAWDQEYLDIPIKKPSPGVTPKGEEYTYSANDMSVADIDGDGEYEYLVKWDPSNSQDVSIKGYTGPCYIDCYKLDGTLLWRLDLGPNIRAGAHYTQFMCYDFNGDGKAEIALKTAPGTRMTLFGKDGKETNSFYITMPEEDRKKGYSHSDSYVCSASDYREHLIQTFCQWQDHPEVKSGRWPGTLEECFHIPPMAFYPLNQEEGARLADYFLDEYAPRRSSRNKLREFEGFIYEGPEYLTMFSGDGREIETIPFPFDREDDGLLWGDYSGNRIEPCNRVDRFLSGVAYLDGKRPYLIICRGYYTRSAIAAYDFFENRFHKVWTVDSGFVPMDNPFDDNPHGGRGTDPVYGSLAGQGNHSLSVCDVDGDGCMEIIYGAACIDHDGSLLYSSHDKLPDGRMAKLGHGDAMHVADIDPDRPGYEIFNVFEGAEQAPYGYALRDAESGEVIFGEYATKDLGRCMVGDVIPEVRGLQCWVNGVGTYDCHGRLLKKETLGTNMSIRWSGDLTTQITDGEDYLKQSPTGVINDFIHKTMLEPLGTKTNNGTKGNPCLVADIFGDFREELLLRTEDSSAIRIYTNTQITNHKLFTLMQDTQYRCGVAWQNNCYNQPCYPKFYYGSDMDMSQVLPYMKARPVLFIAGDSTNQTYWNQEVKTMGIGEKLMSHLDPGNLYEVRRQKNSGFSNEAWYQSRHLIVDNCAMAGRSTKSFVKEGRLDDIKARMKEGDYLLIQFGHNDASANKPERYVPVSEFSDYLNIYVRAAREQGALPVLVSPVCICPTRDRKEGERGEIEELLPEYAREMERFARKEGIPFINLYQKSSEYCIQAGEENALELYIEDQVHLSEKGADCYAGLLAEDLKSFIMGTDMEG
ncbi:rhamnogalacturonan lyase family protein [Lacrimispora aerotolerans]|uniref:rhamnogalacturonan lyase family protein n=1 Tax=Lacrimispora aerotolerans TaxID=36832 RepID=UPI00054DC862|nr:SGNH/GDSL hydrolase family protein [Lacrimispora aerotolerans]